MRDALHSEGIHDGEVYGRRNEEAAHDDCHRLLGRAGDDAVEVGEKPWDCIGSALRVHARGKALGLHQIGPQRACA